MPRRRHTWKTIVLSNSLYAGRVQSALGSSRGTIPEHRTFTLTRGGGGGEVETDMPYSWLKLFFRFADVPVDWGNIVTDTMSLDERVKQWEAEDA